MILSFPDFATGVVATGFSAACFRNCQVGGFSVVGVVVVVVAAGVVAAAVVVVVDAVGEAAGFAVGTVCKMGK